MASDEHLEWFPFYPGRFLTNITVATAPLEAVGALSKLQAHQWIHGAVPKDLDRMARLIGTDPDTMRKVWDVIGEEFAEVDEGFILEELEEVREQQLSKRKQRSKAGKKGARQRWGKEDRRGDDTANGSASSPANGTANAAAKESPEDTDSDGNNALSLSLSSDVEVTMDEEFEAWWKAYPQRKGNNPKGEALEAYKARRREGVTAAELLDGVKRYAAQRAEEGEVGTPFVMRATTFLRSGEGWLQEWTLTGSKARGDQGVGDDPGLEPTVEARKGWAP